jgi:hypothetical protein
MKIGYKARMEVISLTLSSFLPTLSVTFKLWLLWYKGVTAGHPLHWALFVSVSGNDKVGRRYDAITVETPGRPRFRARCTETYDRSKSSHILGLHPLCDVPDPTEFHELAMSPTIPVPLFEHGEDCQTWIWKVVLKAIKERKISATAETELKKVPKLLSTDEESKDKS